MAHHPPSTEPKKQPPVNVETIAPDKLAYWSGCPTKSLRESNVITEAMIPLETS